MNIVKLKTALEGHEPKSVLEAIGIGRLTELVERLPVVVDAEIEDYEDYLDVLDAVNWGDKAQHELAIRDCERLLGFLAEFRLAGDGSDLGAKINPMPSQSLGDGVC